MANDQLNSVQWNVNAQAGVLTDVLLGKPDCFRWVPLNSISAVNQLIRKKLDIALIGRKPFNNINEWLMLLKRMGSMSFC